MRDEDVGIEVRIRHRDVLRGEASGRTSERHLALYVGKFVIGLIRQSLEKPCGLGEDRHHADHGLTLVPTRTGDALRSVQVSFKARQRSTTRDGRSYADRTSQKTTRCRREAATRRQTEN